MMSLRSLPNCISLLRMILVIPVVYTLLIHEYAFALILFFIAGISDGLDGFLAKHYHWKTRLGSILDPIADKVLLVASFATLSYMGLLPMWLFMLVIARDLIIVIGAVTYHYYLGKFDLSPLWSSKINTSLQILLVLFVIIQQQWAFHWNEALTIGIWLVVVAIINSGTEYLIIWGARAWKQIKKDQ